jgi:hypothetical protein
MNTFPLVKCGNILLSSVITSTQYTHEECRNMLLNLAACNSGAGTAAQGRALHHTGDNMR